MLVKMSNYGFKDYLKSVGAVLSLPALAGAVVYFSGALVLGSFNPFEWNKLEKQQIAKSEARKQKLTRLNELENKILRKAEMRDGQPGLSFLDRAHLLRDLGIETSRFQESDRLHLYTATFTEQPILRLEAGPYSVDISEERAKAYLGE